MYTVNLLKLVCLKYFYFDKPLKLIKFLDVGFPLWSSMAKPGLSLSLILSSHYHPLLRILAYHAAYVLKYGFALLICDPIQQKVHLVYFNKLYNDTKIRKNWSDTFERTTFTKSVFPFIFFIFYPLFCSLSQNEPGRQDVPFVVLGHD